MLITIAQTRQFEKWRWPVTVAGASSCARCLPPSSRESTRLAAAARWRCRERHPHRYRLQPPPRSRSAEEPAALNPAAPLPSPHRRGRVEWASQRTINRDRIRLLNFCDRTQFVRGKIAHSLVLHNSRSRGAPKPEWLECFVGTIFCHIAPLTILRWG
jgi:hypothetical protein